MTVSVLTYQVVSALARAHDAGVDPGPLHRFTPRAAPAWAGPTQHRAWPPAVIVALVGVVVLIVAQARSVGPPAADIPGGQPGRPTVCGYENRVPGNPVLSGGHAPGGVVAVAPPGAIPAIDRPRFETVEQGRRWLGPDAPVVVVRVGTDVRAYPSAILLWHEVVNDVVGGTPLLITFCPLCNTAVVYERTFGGRAHPFDVTGQLLLGAAVLRDRAFGTTYAQPTGRRIGGSAALGPLRWYPSDLMTLAQAAAANPGLRVLSRDTGYHRDYGTSPYAHTAVNLFDGYVDAQLEPTTRLVGAVVAGSPHAWRYDALRDARVRTDTVAGQPVLVIFRADTTSITTGRDLTEAPSVGSAGMFDPRVGGRMLHFAAHGEREITDRETGTVWDLTGLARRGPLAGTRLRVLPHLDTYWYAWAARHPDTGLWPPLRPGECSLGTGAP